MIGGAGDDYLYGEINVGSYGGLLGNDILDGGAGNDQLVGGFGSDTYLFGRGDGQDIIINDGDFYSGSIDPTVGKLDVLQFEDIASTEVTLSRSGMNLVIQVTGSTDRVTINNYFVADGLSPRGHAVEQIRFSNGVTWDVATVKSLVPAGFAQAAVPVLTTWALSNALLEFHTSGNDAQLIGGDASRYGLNGNSIGVGAAAGHSVINDPQFGTAAQTLSPVGTAFSGDVRLA